MASAHLNATGMHLRSFSLWTALCVALAALVLGIGFTPGCSRKPEPQPKSKKNVKNAAADTPAPLEPQEEWFATQLASQLGMPISAPPTAHEILRMTVELNLERQRLQPALFGLHRTPWLSAQPSPLAGPRRQSYSSTPLDRLSGTVELPAAFTHYQIELANSGPTPVPMPIVYQDIRRDSLEALMASTGFLQVPDELDRAIALWRFIVESRVHANPVTETAEEHDLIKFLACYGYGFCDDAARALATLAGACGLEARVCGLNGHVVAEIFAAGAWRMFDADFQCYFHAANQPREILGLNALSQNPDYFAHATVLGSGGPFTGEYARWFLTREDNALWRLDSSVAHRIAYVLRPGERIVLCPFHWGRAFVGRYSHAIPWLCNGFIEVPFASALEAIAQEVRWDRATDVIQNRGSAPAHITCVIASPFPIVGGEITNLIFDEANNAALIVEDRANGIRHRCPITPKVSLNPLVAMLTATPTYTLHLTLEIPAQSQIQLGKTPRIRCDIQCADGFIPRLKPGMNTLRTAPAQTDGAQVTVQTW